MKIILLLSLGFLLTCANELKEYQESNGKLTANVYKEIAKSTSGNMLVCPLSVEIVLAMVFAGARGKTAEELSAAVSLPNDSDKVVQMFSKIIPQLESSDKYTFESANKIYVQNKYKIREQYKDMISSTFKGEIDNIDFTQSDAASTINKWVEQITHNKITDVVSQSGLDEDSRLMIVNAMYFKGQWTKAFKESDTTLRPFFLNNTHYIDTHMMSNKGDYGYHEDSKLDAKFLEISYKGDDVALIIALPNNPENINMLENNMDSVLKTEFEHKVTINIRIPKFKVKETIKFKSILQSLGASLPFANGAEFNGMMADDEIEPLKIAEIVQKVTIEIDEEGTVAAAATTAHMQLWRSSRVLPNLYFYADHPFVYYIKHKILGITFIGRYLAPEGNVQTGHYEAPIDKDFESMRVQVP